MKAQIKQTNAMFTHDGDYSFLEQEETASASKNKSDIQLMWIKRMGYMQQPVAAAKKITHEDLMWLKRPGYATDILQKENNSVSDNSNRINMEGFKYVPKNLISDVLYGQRFNKPMPFYATVCNSINNAKSQREFYFKTSTALVLMLNVLLLIMLF